MIEIIKLTDNSFQTISVVNEDGLIIDIEFIFFPTQNRWIYNLSNNQFILKGSTLSISPNDLYRYDNLIEFGMSVVSVDGFGPSRIDDFSKNRIQVFILNTLETQEVSKLMS